MTDITLTDTPHGLHLDTDGGTPVTLSPDAVAAIVEYELGKLGLWWAEEQRALVVTAPHAIPEHRQVLVARGPGETGWAWTLATIGLDNPASRTEDRTPGRDAHHRPAQADRHRRARLLPRRARPHPQSPGPRPGMDRQGRHRHMTDPMTTERLAEISERLTTPRLGRSMARLRLRRRLPRPHRHLQGLGHRPRPSRRLRQRRLPTRRILPRRPSPRRSPLHPLKKPLIQERT